MNNRPLNTILSFSASVLLVSSVYASSAENATTDSTSVTQSPVPVVTVKDKEGVNHTYRLHPLHNAPSSISNQ